MGKKRCVKGRLEVANSVNPDQTANSVNNDHNALDRMV